jgi:hypothetical protein
MQRRLWLIRTPKTEASGAPNKALTMVVHDGGRRVEIAVRG